LLDGVKGLFTGGRHFEKSLRLIAGIFAAPSAVDNAFTLRAIPYLAHAAITYVRAVSNTTDAINVLGLKFVFVFFCPLLGHFLFLFHVIGLCGDVSAAIRADQSAVSYLFFHFCSPFLFFLLMAGVFTSPLYQVRGNICALYQNPSQSPFAKGRRIFVPSSPPGSPLSRG
jgi:hypothetical protein